MRIEVVLGVGPTAGLTVRDLFKRGALAFETMRAGQAGLDFLEGDEAVLDSRLLLKEGLGYVLETDVPEKPQLQLIPHPRRGRRRDDLGDLARDDGADDAQKLETAALLQASANLLDRVGEVVSTQGDVKAAIRRLEEETGLDSAPARRFHYLRQGEFLVFLDGEEVAQFASEAVRTGVTASELLEVECSLVPSRAESLVLRTKVDSCKGDGAEGGVTSGGNHSVRIVNPTWWQRVVLDAARSLRWKLQMDLVEVISTCTLERMPADVHCVHNWMPLLEATHGAIGEVLRAAKDLVATVPEACDESGESEACIEPKAA